MYRVSGFVRHFALALIGGTVAATVWVNLAPESYYDLIEWRLFPLPRAFATLGPDLTLRAFVGDVLMAFFLFYLGKEFWESFMLERGAMRRGQGGVPLIGAAGGVIGAALAWLVFAALFQTAEEAHFTAGWTVPLGSDVVLGYLFGRLIFGAGSPAVHLLLILTISMDLLALLILSLATLSFGAHLLWLLLPLGAVCLIWWRFGRHLIAPVNERERLHALQLWPYAIAGIASWIGIAAAGLPPALGLLPLLPAIPHADRAFGMFAEAEEYLKDPLNRFAHLLVWPVVAIMALFGLTHGGIDREAWTATSGILLGALWIGKPLGILIGALVVAPRLGYRLQQSIRRRQMVLIAGLAGIGFTLPALSLERSLPGGSMQEAARLALGLSILAGVGTWMLARRIGIKRRM
jgi:Na+:H+ antiporter, NhaA family